MTDAPASDRGPRRGSGTPRPLLLIPVVVGVLAVVFGVYEIVERNLLAPRVSMETLHFLHIIRGIASSLLLAGIVAWYLLRRGMPVFPPSPGAEAPTALVELEERARQNGRWFVHARWVAVGVILGLILIAVPLARMLPRATLVPLLVSWGVLANATQWLGAFTVVAT